MSDDIAALMAHLGHEFYSVLGEDWGAVIGYQVAARGIRAMLVDAEQNRQAAQEKLDIPVPALDVDGHVLVAGHLFDVGHDLAEGVPDEVADVVLPFLAEQL